MPILYLVVATSLALFDGGQHCSDWQACRDSAVAAAGREDYEAFHDLAWRAVQKGPKHEPALMLLLARAQSLSGRPGDALVMLVRLADQGVATDVASSADFRRVRSLPGWADLERRISGIPAPTADAPPVSTPPTDPAASSKPPGPAPSSRATSGAEPAEALRFAPGGLVPDALAYDGVSRRFLIADRNARKLAVVDEFSQHVATLAGAQADFGDIEAIEIDSRAGDLWVASSEPAAAGGATTLHKLQLISGRVLATFALATPLVPARFVDVAVANGGTILVLDSRGRIFRLKGSALELAAPVPPGATSLAPTDNGSVYVSIEPGVVRVDVALRTSSLVLPAGAFDLSRLHDLRWHRGALVGVQRLATGTRVVRLRLDRAGRKVVALESLDTLDAKISALTISGNTLYYFAAKENGDVVLKKVAL